MLDALLIKDIPESEVLEAYFIQAMFWSLGAGLLEDGRIKFDAQVKNLASLTSVNDDDKTLAGPGKESLL